MLRLASGSTQRSSLGSSRVVRTLTSADVSCEHCAQHTLVGDVHRPKQAGVKHLLGSSLVEVEVEDQAVVGALDGHRALRPLQHRLLVVLQDLQAESMGSLRSNAFRWVSPERRAAGYTWHVCGAVYKYGLHVGREPGDATDMRAPAEAHRLCPAQRTRCARRTTPTCCMTGPSGSSDRFPWACSSSRTRT